MATTCAGCGATILADNGKLPPWCPKCGQDLPKAARSASPSGAGTGDAPSVPAEKAPAKGLPKPDVQSADGKKRPLGPADAGTATTSAVTKTFVAIPTYGSSGLEQIFKPPVPPPETTRSSDFSLPVPPTRPVPPAAAPNQSTPPSDKGTRKTANSDRLAFDCRQCGKAMVADERGRLPPWCPSCGADRPKDGAPRAATAAECEASTNLIAPPSILPANSPAGMVAGAVRELSGGRPAKKAAPKQPANVPWDDRFELHNFLMGAALFLMALLTSSDEPTDAAQRFLEGRPGLSTLFGSLQYCLQANALVLVVAGIGIRLRKKWGYYLTYVAAIAAIMMGCMFFGGFFSLGPTTDLVSGVAKFTFFRENLDLIIALVDGGGLLYFLIRHGEHLESAR